MILGVVCARAGSRGLPGKSLRPLLGVPLIEWAIQAAVDSDVDQVAVNTDIQHEFPRYPVRRIERPVGLAGSGISKWMIWQHTLEAYAESVLEVEAVVDVDVTRPLRTVEDINGCISRWRQGDVDAVMATAPAAKHPAFDIVEEAPDGTLTLCRVVDPPVVARQQLPPAFYHGGVYVVSAEALRTKTDLWECCVAGHIIPENHAWDIDTITDWQIVEMLMGQRVSRAA